MKQSGKKFEKFRDDKETCILLIDIILRIYLSFRSKDRAINN